MKSTERKVQIRKVQLKTNTLQVEPEEADELGETTERGGRGAIGLIVTGEAMSSCVGSLPAPDDYLGLNPSMVHPLSNVVDHWLIQSGHVPLARTCSIMVPQVLRTKG
ncbi:hypothetical protein PIB30_023290 [Stylosanthes scabra]|uniref:Uncharacterized protein n=1 Tax=Stylosanthes scabra TaxID=79078 RepID=A0ABU6Q904_9FABA|nr:hypothetical protein [Stylosanthes scabra]